MTASMLSLSPAAGRSFGQLHQGAPVAAQRAAWSAIVEEFGVKVRVYEREPGSVLYREVRVDGRKDRRSLEHRDRALAEQQARALATRLAEAKLIGTTRGTTLGQLVTLYLQRGAPLLSPARQRAVRMMVRLLEQHFGRALVMEDLSSNHLDGYIEARRSGRLVSPRHRTPCSGVRDGTIRNELRLLHTLIRWGQRERVDGRRVLTSDPMQKLSIPREQNPMRPIATEARYRALLAVADRADRLGRFRCLLTLVRETGRRINAVCQLRVSDVLRSSDAMVHALAAIGQPVSHAEHWPHGALRWRKEHDKKGYETVAPLSRAAREALDHYLRQSARAGDVPLFPGREDPAKSVTKETAAHWLRRAERLAKLPHLARGGFHPYRRLWASERRHLPAQDVAAAGGWRSIDVMQEAYQHADAATMFAVVDHPSAPVDATPSAPGGHTADTPQQQVAN